MKRYVTVLDLWIFYFAITVGKALGEAMYRAWIA